MWAYLVADSKKRSHVVCGLYFIYERNKMDKKIYLDNAATTRPYLEAI